MSYEQSILKFRDAIFDLISETVRHKRIYPARTNFVKPNEDYVTYRITNINPIEGAGYYRNSLSEPETSYLNYEVIVDIQVIDPDRHSMSGRAQALAGRIRHGFSMNEVRYKHLVLNDIGYLRSSTISDTSAVSDGESWEQRASFLCFFHIIIAEHDESGSDGCIETVIFNGDIDTGAIDHVIINDTVVGKELPSSTFPLPLPFTLS